MNKDNKIYIAGHKGMVGSAILRNLKNRGFNNLVFKTHSELPLDQEIAVNTFFEEEKPEYVFLAAAKVGGIAANIKFGGEFILKNLKIQTNTIEAAKTHGTSKLIFLGSSCIYPKLAQQPIKEESLLTGKLEESNLPYAIAKIAGKVMCDAYRKQFKFNAMTVMPSNVYGIGDNFHPENSHVVAGMMYRLHNAKINNYKEVIIWGSGNPLRELIDAEDLADACIFLMQNYDEGGMVNVGSSKEISIRELAFLLAKIINYSGELKFDTSRPDGTPRKIMDNSILEKMNWFPKTSIENGLNKMYSWFLENKPTE